MVNLECKYVPYQKDTQVLFSKKYLFPPIVTASLCYDFLNPGEHEITPYNITPSIVCLIEQENGINQYIGVRIVWSGDIDTIDDAFISIIAVCRDNDD